MCQRVPKEVRPLHLDFFHCCLDLLVVQQLVHPQQGQKNLKSLSRLDPLLGNTALIHSSGELDLRAGRILEILLQYSHEIN